MELTGAMFGFSMVGLISRVLHAQDRMLWQWQGKHMQLVQVAASLAEDASSVNFGLGGPNKPDGLAGARWFWLIGVCCTLCGATMTTLGLLAQKRSHLLHTPEAAPRHGTSFQPTPAGAVTGSPAKPYWMRSHWLGGALLWLSGNVVCWLGMGLAPQSILSVMDCWNIVVALAISPWFFGEPVSRKTCLAAVMLVVGCLWVISFGPKAYQPETVDRLIQACTNHLTIYSVICTFVFLLGMACLAYHDREKVPSLSAFQFTMISAIFAWYASVSSKSTAALIVTSVTTSSAAHFVNWMFAMFSGSFLLCAVCQIHFLNLGMKYGDAIIVIPSYMAMSMLGQIVFGGLFFFQEFRSFGFAAHAWFWPGVLCVLSGVSVLRSEDLVQRGEGEQAPLLSGAKKRKEEMPDIIANASSPSERLYA